MLKCKIIFKGQEFEDAEAFSEYLRSAGLEVFEGFDSEVAKIVVEKYSPKGEDSVAEMMTKLEAAKVGVKLTQVTQEDIDKYLFPKGQAHDYITQSRIHANTYAGVKATGISANFSKMLAYLFSATPIVEITDSSTGESFNVDTKTDEGKKNYNKLTTKNGVPSLYALVKQKPNYQISKRGDPAVKDKYAIRVNNRDFDKLSRNELNYDGTPKMLFKNLPGRELLINVFETIDTIINLAIDNVKEQKLFMLGLTNSNANAMMSMIGFGVPLNDVVRLFKSPIIVEASKARRLQAHKLTRQAKEIAKTLSDEEITAYLKATKQKDVLAQFVASADAFNQTFAQILENNTDILTIDTTILDQVYTGRSKHTNMSNVAALATLAKLTSLGTEMFDYSQLFSLLRGMPSKKWKMDKIADIPLKYNEFIQVETINKDVKAQTLEEMENLFRESDEFKALPTAGAQEAAVEKLRKELEVDDSIYSEELKRTQRSWFLNRLSRNTLVRSMEPSDHSAFSNVSVLGIPHVYTAWRILHKLIRVIEETFALHSPRIATLAKNIISEVKHEDAYVKQEFQEQVQNNFVKFIASNMLVNMGDRTIDLSVSKDEFFTSSTGRNFYGEDAWIQRFISEISPFIGKGSNELLKSIQVRHDKDSGTKQLLLTSDKVGEDELVEILKRDFLALSNISPELPDKLFKYAAITSGLYYGRTNFSLIFPVEYALAFDKALNTRLEEVITKSNVQTDINLRVIEDQFLYQFVRNNAAMLSYVNKIKPVVTGEIITPTGKRRLNHGVDDRPYGRVYYDLKFPITEGTNYDKIIRTYGTTSYLKLDTPTDEEFVYYRVFTVASADSTYSFDEEDLNKGLNIDLLRIPGTPILTLFDRHTNTITLNATSKKDYEVGQTIYLNPKTAKLTELMAYEVIGVSEEKRNGNVYSIKYSVKYNENKNIDLSHKSLVQKLRDRPYYAELGNNTKYAEVATSQEEAITRSRRSGTLGIIGGEAEGNPNIYSIDLTRPIDEVISRIAAIPNANRYVVDKNVVNSILFSDPAGAIRIANALFSKTGFEHPIVARSDEDVAIESALSLKFKIKDITSAEVKANKIVNGKVSMDDLSTPGKVKEGSILYLGVSKEQHIFAHVKSIVDNVAEIGYVDSVVFNHLTKRTYTVEEMENIKEKLKPC